MSADGSKKAIFAAAGANCGIAIAKFAGFLITGASSMLAESVHSLADTTNQILLLIGNKRSRKEADQLHQFGYGRNRYFYAFVVGLIIFSAGSMFALYEGVDKIIHPEEVKDPIVAISILVVAILLEGYSFLTAFSETKKILNGQKLWSFIRTTKAPELPVVLLEDTGALFGLIFALIGICASWFFKNPVFDGIGTLAIGILLAIIAFLLVMEMHSLLIGEGATEKQVEDITAGLTQNSLIKRVIHIRTEYLDPENLLIAAKIAVDSDVPSEKLARMIDEAEKNVRDRVPEATYIFIEPDIDRTDN